MKKKISLADAKALVQRYRENAQKKHGEFKLPNSVDFDLSTINNLINTPGVKGIRAYFTQDEANQVSLFLVGYNGTDEDVLPSSTSDTTSVKTATLKATTDIAIDEPGRVCPPSCSTSSF